MKKLLFSIILLSHITIHGRDSSGYLARALSWLKNEIQEYYHGLKLSRTHLPQSRLDYAAAQVNDAISPQLTNEQRRILIEVLKQFKMLASNAAQGHEEPQELLASLLTPQGRSRYTQEFAFEEHKQFLASETGQKALAELLVHVSRKRPMVSYTQLRAAQEKLGAQIVLQAEQWYQYLQKLDQIITTQQTNPKVAQALKQLETDPTLQEHLERSSHLDQLLEEQSQDPELKKLLPLLQQKDQELQAQLIQVTQTPGITQEQFEEKKQEIIQELEDFIAQYPPLHAHITMIKERVQLEQTRQEYIERLYTDHPALQKFMELAQGQEAAIDNYNECVRRLQGVPQLIAQRAAKRNAHIWCSHAHSWFTACIKALKNNTHHDEHIVHYDDEFKRQRAEFRQLAQGWDDLAYYKVLKQYNEQHKETTNKFIEAEYKKLSQTKDDIVTEIEQEVARLLNLPENVQEALTTLGIDDIKPVALSAQHKTRIKKQYRKKSLENHSDKNPNDPQADQKQAAVNQAYTQLNNLLEPDITLTEEQQEQYHMLQQQLKLADVQLYNAHYEARKHLIALYKPLDQEKMIKQDIKNNTLFQQRYPQALQKARKQIILPQHIISRINPQEHFTSYQQRVHDHT